MIANPLERLTVLLACIVDLWHTLICLAPLLLYIKAGTGFIGKLIMTMNRG